MNIAAFIPCRKGSKSIKDKNIKLLGGRPLMAWSIDSAFKSGVGRVIVSTDSDEYAQIAREYNAEIMMRPANLGKDTTSMFDVLKSEVPKINPVPDLVMLLQPTSPFRKNLHIKLAISCLTANLEKYDSIISAEKVPEKYNPYAMIIETSAGKRMVVRKLIGLKEKISAYFTGETFAGPTLSGYPVSQRMTRRQDLPQCWLPDGSIYLFKTENLKHGSIYGDEVMILENEGTPNLNEISDWERAEKYLAQKT